MGWVYLILPLIEGLLLIKGPFSTSSIVLSDVLYLIILTLHIAAGLSLILKIRIGFFYKIFRISECLLVISILFFLFSYIYALNANMDYVQRFITSGGAVRLALDTTRERLNTAVRFLPLVMLNSFYYVFWRIKLSPLLSRKILGPRRSIWALPLVMLSVFLGVLSFPSFIKLEGLPWLAFFALVPLFCVLEVTPYRWGLFYGVSFGVFHGMLVNFWLGTYSLITLQLVSVYFLFVYTPFFVFVLWLVKRLKRLRWLVLPLAWVLMECLRSQGFFGYPWGLWGTTQYGFISLIQIASITGVWGVSFIVLLVNAGISETLNRLSCSGWKWDFPLPMLSGSGRKRHLLFPVLTAAGLLILIVCAGAVCLIARRSLPVQHTVKIALIQQNADPRKHDYRETFECLQTLTDLALEAEPDIIIWSETAFVPNIRRWSNYAPAKHPLVSLVRDFLEYQMGLNTWLLTGNDDYEIIKDKDGNETRLDYNAAVLFSPEGRRMQTYHKIHLVPFTEHFPWKERLPWAYELLKRYDVYLWEPGEERIVFRHPLFSFITPICFEDAFPGDIRAFMHKGVDAIINISNDYWSLSEVEAKQHTINSIFRAVENRKPLLRATASGLTCFVDSEGRMQADAPYYVETFLVADVCLRKDRMTLYTRFGDWFPLFLGLILGVHFILSFISRFRDKF